MKRLSAPTLWKRPESKLPESKLIDFTSNAIVETKEVSENIYLDVDQHGHVVSVTIEQLLVSGRLLQIGMQFRFAVGSTKEKRL